MDYQAHNEQVKQVWDTFNAGAPIRMPVILGINARYYMPLPEVNPQSIDFQHYTNDPAVMLDIQMRCDRYKRMHIPADHEMGLPEAGWAVHVDFQNYYEAAWFGCGVLFIDGNVPDTRPLLTADSRHRLFDAGLPDPESGIMSQALAYYETMTALAKTVTLDGLPPVVGLPGCTTGTDGPFTMACELRGATEMCLELYEDPTYACQLLDYITDATIQRIRHWRAAFGLPETFSYGFADDSIALLSVPQYEQFILPRHRRLIDAFSDGSHSSIHLCGNAGHLFSTLKEKLDIYSFDTGFPLAHGAIVQQLGPDVRINGGPHVDLLRLGTPEAVAQETQRIIGAVTPHTRWFVMREANNLAPGTPLANLQAMYDTVCTYGQY